MGSVRRWPLAICTDLAVLTPNPVSRELEIAAIYPFTTLEEVKERTGFPIRIAAGFKVVEPPTAEEIKILREQLDVTGDFTGWKKLFA